MKWSFLLLTLVACLFSKCQKKTDILEQSDTMRISIASDPVSLDPRLVRSLKDLTVVKQLGEGLTRTDGEGKPVLALAERIDLSDDCLTYTVHLKSTKWSDGTELTAHDFARSWKETLSSSFPSDYAYMLYPIQAAEAFRKNLAKEDELGIQVVDAHTLEVILSSPLPYFLELLAFPTYFPVKEGVTNGPFKLSQWKRGRLVELVKNPYYWDVDSVSLQMIEMSIVDDSNTESLLFEKGELDWLGQPFSNSIVEELTEKLKNEGKLNSYSVAGTFWLRYNTEAPPFNNMKVRQAFAYALDRKKMIEHILHGNQVAATSPLPPSMAVQTDPYFIDGDLLGAKALFHEALEEMHLDVHQFPKITLSYQTSDRNKKIVQLIKDEWEKAFGIHVGLEGAEREVFRRRIRKRKYQVGTGDWIADFNDPIAFLELFKEREGAVNGTGWENTTYQQLLNASYDASNLEKRQQLFRQATSLLMREMPIVPLYHYSFDYQKKEGVCDIILLPTGLTDFKTARIAH